MKNNLICLSFCSVLIVFLFYSDALSCECEEGRLHAYTINKHDTGVLTTTLSQQFTKYEYTNSKTNLPNKKATRAQGITQIIAGYDFSDSMGLQVNIPFASYNFDTVSNYRSGTDADSGLSDISVIANYFPFFSHTADKETLLTLSFGVKLPTGDTGSLTGKTSTTSTDQTNKTVASSQLAHHASILPSSRVSASSASFLTLGSGSFDFPLGTSFISRVDRVLFLTSILYTARTEGSFDYRFANDLFWNLGTGYYLLIDHKKSVSLSAVLSGEHKPEDELSGKKIGKTAQDNLFLGPQLNFYLGNHFTGELGFDLPIRISNSDAETSPAYKIRALVSYNF